MNYTDLIISYREQDRGRCLFSFERSEVKAFGLYSCHDIGCTPSVGKEVISIDIYIYRYIYRFK